VQIRTHAQKYFQKLAKARQNGEEGDVSMEGRGSGSSGVGGGSGSNGGISIGNVGRNGGGALGNGGGGGGAGAGGGSYNGDKRRRPATGTKRKAIKSVVASAQREGKRLAAEQQPGTEGRTKSPPAIAPVLAPFVAGNLLPPNVTDLGGNAFPSITTAHHGTISGAALEDSLFRFLTPTTGDSAASSQHLNDVARQAGANPITLPSNSTSKGNNIQQQQQQQFGGDVSPTGVADLSLPNWVWSSDPPAWYSKGADVDELLNEADALDWLADSGDLNESYPSSTTVPNTSMENPVTIPNQENDKQHQLPVPVACTDTQQQFNGGQAYHQFQVQSMEDQLSNNVLNGIQIPPSIPSLNKNNETELESNLPTVSNGSGPVAVQGVNGEDTATSSMNQNSSASLSMPPLPSLFESSNSINILSDMKRKDSCISAGVGNLSSASLFVSGADSTDGFFGDGTLEEEEFVTALLD